jgi:hypothetical protein
MKKLILFYGMLEELPLLVLDEICEYLKADTFEDAIGFASLCQTNKYCYEVTRRARDSRLSLNFYTPSELIKRIEEFSGRHQLIRTIVVDGCMWAADEEDNEEDNGEDNGEEDREKNESEDESETDEEDTEEADEQSENQQEPIIEESWSETSGEFRMATKIMWEPLAQFLLKCRGLKELVWQSDDQVPRCILDILHDQLPRVHLHVDKFDLRSLHQEPDHLHDIDPDEYMLATSPSLRTVGADVDYEDADGSINYNYEAILQMVSGLAPNLQRVSLGFQAGPVSSQPEWGGFFANEKLGSCEARATGKLVEFRYFGTIPEFVERCPAWQRSTDFTLLESLGLMLPDDDSAFQMLIKMAQSINFKSLSKLELQSTPEHTYDNTQHSLLEELLGSLPPLQSLLMGFDTHPFNPSIFSNHGRLLTTFHVRIPDTVTALQELRTHCPQLQNLQFTMRRRCGDEREVLLYQELGSFPKLVNLSIYMELGRNNHMGPPIVPISNTSYIRIFKWSLANSAIDYRLASEIFNRILRVNRDIRPDIMPSFERLRILPRVVDGYEKFTVLQSFIARSWVCERRYADISSESVGGVELEEEKHELDRWKREFFWVSHRQDEHWQTSFIMQAWKENWPVASFNDTAWLSNWKSYPLWPYDDGPAPPVPPYMKA